MHTRLSKDFMDHETIIKYFSIFSSLLDQLPVAFYYSRMTDNSWTVHYVSNGITRLLGYKKEDIIGKMGFDDLIIENEFYKTMPIRSDMATGRFSYLYTMKTSSNKPKRVIDKGLFLFDGDGQLMGGAGVMMDFTLEADFDILDYLPSTKPVESKNQGTLEQIIGFSPPMRLVVDRIKKIAPTHGHILIQGESGTGKELTARAIHDLSDNHARPLIAINCGAISEHLMESEFFGHVKGAFSGATENRKGYLDVVDNGSLFLDEVGEMPVNMQVKLLRVLDGYGYTPVGSTRTKKTDFRLICATNRDLESSVAAGVMRLDFYHRIKQLTITLPPLRERIEDIEPLIEYFAERYFNDNHITHPDDEPILPAEILAKFKSHNWPGNVRELHHAVIKYLSMGEIDFSPPQVQPQATDTNNGSQGAITPGQIIPETYEEYDRLRLIKTLNQYDWNTAKAAAVLGKTQRTIQRKIAQYGLKTRLAGRKR